MSEQCERMSERTSEWPSTYVSILVCSRPRRSLSCSSTATAGAVVSEAVVAVNPAAGEDGDRGGTFLGEVAILLWFL